MYGDPYEPFSEEDAAQASAGTERASGPEVGLLESIGLGYRRGGVQEDWGLNQVNHESRAVVQLYDALAARGHRLERVPFDQFRAASRLPEGVNSSPAAYREQIAAVRAFWRALAAERARDPAFLPEMADVGDYASLLAHVAAKRNAEMGRIDARLQGGSGVGGFIGQIGHGFTDPTSYIPLGAASRAQSAARAILGTAAREAGANVALTIAMEPLVQSDAASLGRERTGGDFLLDIGVSGVAGGAIGGTAKGLQIGIPKAIDALTPLDRKIARALEQAEPDAAAFMRQVPPGFRTPDEQAALNVVARAAEVNESSPFVAGPKGDEAHADLLDGWLDRIMQGGEQSLRPPSAPVARADLAAGTADPAALRAPARETLKARIHRAEAPGRDDYNEASGATGPYQFVRSTWISYYKRRYGSRGLTDDQIAAKRRDPALNDVLMNDLIEDNARALRNAGQPETAGNLYLLHFAGPALGVAALRSPGEKVSTLAYRVMRPGLAAKVLSQNPHIRNMTGADLVAWANSKMGDGAAVPSPRSAGAESPSPQVGEGVPEIRFAEREADPDWLGLGDSPQLRPELFDAPEAHARAQLAFERERDAAEGFTWIRDDAPEYFDPWDRLDDMRAYARGKGSLKPEKVAEALGLTPEQGRRLTELLASVKDSPIRQRRDGRFARVPKMPDTPQSLLEFIAARGGVEEIEKLSRITGKPIPGELRGMGAETWHKGAKFRRRLLRERSPNAHPDLLESPDHGLDAHFAAAIDAGYFPELAHMRGSDFSAGELPDMQIMLDAIDAELRGRPLYRPEHDEAVLARIRELDPQEADAIEAIALQAREMGFDLDPVTAGDALAWMARGRSADEAVELAIHEAAWRDLDDYGQATGDPDYAREWSDDDVDFRDRGADPADDEGLGRSEAFGGAEEARGAELAQLEDSAGAADGLEPFDDPIGPAAERQSDSIEHDARMAVGEPDAIAFAGKPPELLDEIEAVRRFKQLKIDPEEIEALRMAAYDAKIEQMPFPPTNTYGAALRRQQGKTGRTLSHEQVLAGIEAADDAVQTFWEGHLSRLRSEVRAERLAREAEASSSSESGPETSDRLFQLDEEGEPVSLRALLEEMEAEQRAIETMRSCMVPPKGDAP